MGNIINSLLHNMCQETIDVDCHVDVEKEESENDNYTTALAVFQ
jgi:hypothetical protein